MAKKIEIVINTDPDSPNCGDFKAEAFGYNGKGCDIDIAVFQTLGTVKSSAKKPEYKHLQTRSVQARA